ncbi:MAG: hypothetical protein WDW38_006924 [Sanguina aurantia]
MVTSAAAPEVLLFIEWPTRVAWRAALQKAGVPALFPEEIQDWGAVRYAASWLAPAHVMQQCPNLEVVASLGAGVDHILNTGGLAESVAITRIVDPLMAQRMSTFVTWAVINGHRGMDGHAEAQRSSIWNQGGAAQFSIPDTGSVRVGIMGNGAMGQACAQVLSSVGYSLSTWSRSDKSGAVRNAHRGLRFAASIHLQSQLPQGFKSFHGRGQLQDFVSQVDFLVCLLPLTAETRGIIDAQLLAWLPRGAGVINVARGAHLVEEDLLSALDSGQVSYACLDVFATEPLPAQSPLWSHPLVRVFPHISSVTDMQNAAVQIAENYKRFLDGQALLNVVDRTAGY